MNGAVAVVTGGASGIGLACAQELARRGATVVVLDLDLAGAQRAAASCGGHGHAVDVGDTASLDPLAARIEREVGPVSMLLNAAGIIQGAMLPPQDMPAEIFERVFRVNLMGTHAACVAFGGRMAQRGHGAILNVASIAGMRSTPLHAYGPMKAAVIQLTQNLATEWGRSGVRVNCISPGPVLTPALQAAVDEGQRDLDRMASSTAAGRVVMPREVATAACFLLSQDAAAVTGVNLPVDHGWLVASSWTSFGGVREAR